MTYIMSGGMLSSTHSLWWTFWRVHRRRAFQFWWLTRWCVYEGPVNIPSHRSEERIQQTQNVWSAARERSHAQHSGRMSIIAHAYSLPSPEAVTYTRHLQYIQWPFLWILFSSLLHWSRIGFDVFFACIKHLWSCLYIYICLCVKLCIWCYINWTFIIISSIKIIIICIWCYINWTYYYYY